VLHHLVGLPVEEVARELGVPTGTVKSRLARGRTALAQVLNTERPEVREDERPGRQAAAARCRSDQGRHAA
jgi:RNA polymerase sigma-70 factor (ECF subfamily)